MIENQDREKIPTGVSRSAAAWLELMTVAAVWMCTAAVTIISLIGLLHLARPR
jgi:hypothetical protein